MDLYCYRAKVEHHYDGDTPTLTISFGWGLSNTARCRMASINAPEITSKDPVVLQKAQDALKFLESLIPAGSDIIVQAHTFDNYGRLLGTIWQNDKSTVSVNQMMLDSGKVVPMKLEKQIAMMLAGKIF